MPLQILRNEKTQRNVKESAPISIHTILEGHWQSKKSYNGVQKFKRKTEVDARGDGEIP